MLLNICMLSYGAYLENIPIQLVQPNGDIINAFITGDEFFRRVHDSDGYSIVKDKNGWYFYAMYDAVSDELMPSEYVVKPLHTVSLPMEKGLGISHKKYMEKRLAYFEPTNCFLSGASKNSLLKDLADSKTTQQVNNIVICIGFADTEEMSNDYPTVNGMFNSDTDNNLKEYFSTMSYGKTTVTSHFFPPNNGTILRFYKDIYPRSYYEGIANNAYLEHALLTRAIDWVNANYPIPSNVNLDINGDGKCDFITFVVYGPVGAWAELLWPHKWSLYTDYVTINGIRVYDYNFELDGTPNYFNNAVFAHEGFHVFGAPDLYHYNWAYRDMKAVGLWDVMDQSTRPKPQSMSAYMKLKYGGWIPELPVTEIDKTYEIFPFYTNDGSNPQKPVIYKVPMTYNYDNEYCVVEYRKKTDVNYDSEILNEGLLIYRINPYYWGNAQFGNGWGDFDEVYLFRPGSYVEGWNGEYTNGDLVQAPFNSTNDRTEFNATTDPFPFFSYGEEDEQLNINNIHYDASSDSYSFYYGNPENRFISVNETNIVLEKDSGSTGTVTVNSNVLWYVSIPKCAASWLASSVSKEINSKTIIFTTLTPNLDKEPRIADVTIFGNDETFVVNVIQEGNICDFAISNLNAVYSSNCIVHLSWSSHADYYNIYRDALLIAENYNKTSYTDEGSDPNLAHTWTVESFCLDNEEFGTASVTLHGGCSVNFLITVSVNPEDGGIVSGGGTYIQNEEVTLSATPNANYKFSNWTKSSIIISTDSIFSFLATEDADFEANFVLKGNIEIKTTEKPTVFYAQNAIHFNNLTPNTLVQITDLLGRVVYEKETLDGSIPFTTKGMYLVVLTNTTTTTAHKIVVW